MKVLESQEQVLTLCKTSFKINVLGFIFSNNEDLHLQRFLWNKDLLSYIFKGLPLPKLVAIICLEKYINHMFVLKLDKNFLILSSYNQQI